MFEDCSCFVPENSRPLKIPGKSPPLFFCRFCPRWAWPPSEHINPENTDWKTPFLSLGRCQAPGKSVEKFTNTGPSFHAAKWAWSTSRLAPPWREPREALLESNTWTCCRTPCRCSGRRYRENIQFTSTPSRALRSSCKRCWRTTRRPPPDRQREVRGEQETQHTRTRRKLSVPKICIFGCFAFSGALWSRSLRASKHTRKRNTPDIDDSGNDQLRFRACCVFRCFGACQRSFMDVSCLGCPNRSRFRSNQRSPRSHEWGLPCSWTGSLCASTASNYQKAREEETEGGFLSFASDFKSNPLYGGTFVRSYSTLRFQLRLLTSCSTDLEAILVAISVALCDFKSHDLIAISIAAIPAIAIWASKSKFGIFLFPFPRAGRTEEASKAGGRRSVYLNKSKVLTGGGGRLRGRPGQHILCFPRGEMSSKWSPGLHCLALRCPNRSQRNFRRAKTWQVYYRENYGQTNSGHFHVSLAVKKRTRKSRKKSTASSATCYSTT